MQRQLRLGDILDDYCPRERRLTNHAVVALVGDDVKQTRCTTCEAEHEYKHAKMPRQRRKGEGPAALYTQVLAGGPKRVTHEPPPAVPVREEEPPPQGERSSGATAETLGAPNGGVTGQGDNVAIDDAYVSGVAPEGEEGPESDELPGGDENDAEEGPVHRPLIRATLPRQEGQPPPTRPAPDFTIRQPGGRPNRFRPRNQRGGQMFQGNRSNGPLGGAPGRGAPRQNGGRPPQGGVTSRLARRHDPGRKRSK